MSKNSRHKKTPVAPTTRAFESNAVNDQENNVMSNISTGANNVIPFRFEAKEVRTLLVNDQPWFVAADVCQALAIRNNRDAIARLDDDEKGVATTDTLRGAQELGIINESGLYSLILTSRKAEAKRFKKWVTAEVLPAIRKHGHYVDHHGAMGDLVGAVIGTSGEHVLDRVIDQKASPVPHSLQRSFKHTMKSRLRSRFNVQRTALIPAECLADACNFVAAYVLEGEYLKKPEEFQFGVKKSGRYLLSFNHKGEQQITQVPDDAYVLSQDDFLKGIAHTPGDIPITTDELFDFAISAMNNLRLRSQSQARRVKP